MSSPARKMLFAGIFQAPTLALAKMDTRVTVRPAKMSTSVSARITVARMLTVPTRTGLTSADAKMASPATENTAQMSMNVSSTCATSTPTASTSTAATNAPV